MKTLLAVALLTLATLVHAEDWALKRAKDADPILKTQKDAERLDHEVVLSASAGSLLIGRNTAFTISGGYHFFIRPELQLGLDTTIKLATGASTFSFLVGPTLNLPFDRDFRDAFFFFGGLGFGTVSGTGTRNEFLFAFMAGKRFHIFQNVIYRPSVGLVKDLVDGTGFEIRFVSVSIAF